MAIAATAPLLPKPEKNSVAKLPHSLTHPVFCFTILFIVQKYIKGNHAPQHLQDCQTHSCSA
jgi:hypothetical protein